MLKKINYFLLFLLLFSRLSEAGNLGEIFFENAMITIHHNACQLKSPLKEKRKLILPLDKCASRAQKIAISHPNLKQIHWAQHDRQTVWIVATFSKDYQYEITSSPYQYRICIPFCQKNQSIMRHNPERESSTMMFMLKDILFKIPLQGMLIDEFLERSIGFVPQDVMRDGLPHFGAKRDDWLGSSRKHKGYDIYANNINVVAAAKGTVIKIRKNKIAGRYVKLYHDAQLYTVYVHLKTVMVEIGQQVKRGEILGRIEGATGNAVEPQLHFEIKPYNQSVDPFPLIEHFYQDHRQIANKIRRYQKTLSAAIQTRNKIVKNFRLRSFSSQSNHLYSNY
ncbi:MAG: hypothetical protein DRR16_18060 [Candidatus Parabeggiatoa sp. nov. 3]|nr:MAG: hypothetical protein DRR00_04585 [Gammaproteobacteria bacterium]RKZ68927.1 MAG: hypothetical protein DRQ99_02450 [Gammaproteobacteria bacterium]RKZ83140.1 MAG: hypothetical protein DRR16_18060 [Gammaproteobacteria bacterium]